MTTTTGHTARGVYGGILTILLANLHSSDIIKTMILAATGALVSFAVSYTLHFLIKRRSR